MSNSHDQITIALAGICQNASLVPALANTGVCDNSLYKTCIESIFVTSPKTTEEVYGEIKNIRTGLQILSQLFASKQEAGTEIARYSINSMAITNKLLKNESALTQISQRLEKLSHLYFIDNNDELDSHINELTYSLAGLYSDTISPLTNKIKVLGKAEYLQNELTQARVRTALLGCVRSSILWYQVGGNRLQLFFSRKKIVNTATDILQKLNHN